MGRALVGGFGALWPYYLGEHRHPVNRWLHVLGTSLALGIMTWLLVIGLWYLMGLGVVVGYAFAWLGHFAVEKNKPASFGHAWFSFLGDCRMWRLAWTGRLGAELQRQGIEA